MTSPPEDSLLRNARREAFWVFVTWIVAFAYTAGYCARYGYGRSIDELTFVWGFPDWVFYGIVLPWAACFAISTWFAFVFMQDEHLGDDTDEALFDDGELL